VPAKPPAMGESLIRLVALGVAGLAALAIVGARTAGIDALDCFAPLMGRQRRLPTELDAVRDGTRSAPTGAGSKTTSVAAPWSRICCGPSLTCCSA
jgi:hypothetical protein